MPFYDYRCPECGHRFEAQHSMSADAPPCPACGAVNPTRLITGVPAVAGGLATNAGDTRGATKEQIREKWAEETPKLRKKLVDKLGEDYVSRNAPSLTPKNE
ncbi:MAG: zinc ribbon domain-containing protein [Chloroflexi bacterium]|nr:zinc ribbon domain-containing protein [Chloroflexota bacterium]